MFCIYLRTNSDLCHLQHKLIGFYNRVKSVYSAVRTGSLNKAVCHSSLKGQIPHSRLQNFVPLPYLGLKYVQRFIKKLKEDLLPTSAPPFTCQPSLFISYHHATTETIGLAYNDGTFLLQRTVETSAMDKRSHNAARKFTCKKSYSGSLHAHKANRERGCKRFA